MTSAAMRQTLDQIGAAIPGFVMRWVRAIRSLPQEQKLPAREQRADVERETEIVRRRRGVDRRPRHEESIERGDVVVGGKREMIDGNAG